MRVLMLVGLFVLTCQWSSAQLTITNLPLSDLASPEIMARSACSLCHVYPDPALLDREVWRDHVLPKMKFYLGVERLDASKTKDGDQYQASGLFPAQPVIQLRHWEKIQDFYLSKAPGRTNTPSRNERISLDLKQFKVDRPRFRREPTLTTAVRIHAADHAILFADAGQQAVDVLSEAGAFHAQMPVGNIVSSILPVREGFFLGCIGHFFPNEGKLGQVVFLEQKEQRLERHVLLRDLPRVAHVERADLNGDGRPDLAVSMFGFLTGRYSWFENLGANQYVEHVLVSKPGAVKSIAYDFNRDGAMDLAVLFGQETDGLKLFMNDGRGTFTERDIIRRPPTFGHADFEIADFNQDGRPDFLVANGDNGDYESPPKPYHGLRVYLGQEDGTWKETWFFPMHGAYHSVARDFDEDGDLDIAAVSFFPDYEQSPRESFVYLECLGGFEYKPFTFPQCVAGRWLTLDAGDVDGDGDLDLALASLTAMPTMVPEDVKKSWEKSGPSVLVLKNQLRSPVGRKN